MFYWTSIDKSSEISSKLSNELALAYKKNRNYDKAFLFYKELSQKDPDNVDYLEAVAEMQVCRGQEKDALRMYENILKLDADNLAANIFLGNYYYLIGLRNSAIYTQSENNQRTDDRHRCQRQ